MDPGAWPEWIDGWTDEGLMFAAAVACESSGPEAGAGPPCTSFCRPAWRLPPSPSRGRSKRTPPNAFGAVANSAKVNAETRVAGYLVVVKYLGKYNLHLFRKCWSGLFGIFGFLFVGRQACWLEMSKTNGDLGQCGGFWKSKVRVRRVIRSKIMEVEVVRCLESHYPLMQNR